jgi:hypothetical protein
MTGVPPFLTDAALSNESKVDRLKLRARHRMPNASEAVVIPQRIKLRDVSCACDTNTDICVCDNGAVFHLLLGNI